MLTVQTQPDTYVFGKTLIHIYTFYTYYPGENGYPVVDRVIQIVGPSGRTVFMLMRLY